MTTPDAGRPGPSLRRVLTLYFTRRPPASLLVDALLMLAIYLVLYCVWSAFPQSYFYPRGDQQEGFVENLLNPVHWLGPLTSMIRYFAWLTVGVAGLRYLGETFQASRQTDPDSLGQRASE